MSNSVRKNRLTEHKVATTFSGMADELEDIIEAQEERLQELADLEKDINQFLGEKYPSNPLKQEREATPFLRFAVWKEYFPLRERLKRNKSILQRMKKRNNLSPRTSSVDVEDVKGVPISDYLEFNKAGKAQCIWHNDENPSLHYYEEQNRVYCFACDEGGDVVDVVQELYSCSFKQALTKLTN